MIILHSQHEPSKKFKKLVNGKRISIRNVPIGKTGLPLQNFRLFREKDLLHCKVDKSNFYSRVYGLNNTVKQ